MEPTGTLQEEKEAVSETFDEAELCETLRRNVSKSGYVKPTPVQKHGIPIISAGRDLMACAQTGSGKTASFLLPILQQLMVDGVAASCFSELQEPEAIIVAPTRELINQIYLEARKFAFGCTVFSLKHKLYIKMDDMTAHI
uniref:RNA helicase n=1 Tax=Monopterus albus TaxID=43700 RepID=A0A3Q3IJ98_MONAL